jgi:hypothetical protein
MVEPGRAASGPLTKDAAVGCLPLPILFVLGILIGRAVGGTNGALWGAGIGLGLGLILGGLFVMLIRRRR